MKILQNDPAAAKLGKLGDSNKKASRDADDSSLIDDSLRGNVKVDVNSLERKAHSKQPAPGRSIEMTTDGALKLTISVKNSIRSQAAAALQAQANFSPQDMLMVLG